MGIREKKLDFCAMTKSVGIKCIYRNAKENLIKDMKCCESSIFKKLIFSSIVRLDLQCHVLKGRQVKVKKRRVAVFF